MPNDDTRAETVAVLAPHQWGHVEDAIHRQIPLLDLYERVHADLEDGKQWNQIDNGMREVVSYEYWQAYMDSAFKNGLRDILLSYRASPQPSEEEVERVARAICDERFIGDAGDGWDDASDGLKEDYRKQALAAIAAMSPRPQPGMISADRACEIVGALVENKADHEPVWSWEIREAINTIRMEAGALPEPPKE